jgi:hypothetical protein
MQSMSSRVIATIIAFIAYAVANILYSPEATLLAGKAAGQQFANDDAGFVSSFRLMRFLSGANGLMTLVLLLVMAAIWWKPIRRWISPLALLALTLTGLLPRPAVAYYDKTDFTEAYTILPNESAFWIPDTGANKDNQSQLESEEYLKANKVAVKRFIVPHQKLSGSGGFFDFYVPSGRLIIVDRTPFSREWVSAPHRGTSAKDESFPCQSKEGLNISVGVSIGASVLEANAARYLYRFGVLSPAGDRSDPKTIFTSVYYSRKLADVMDDVGRKKVQTLVCDEITSRSFDRANEEAVQVMEAVKQKAADYFSAVGITLDFIGWADTFTFDHEVQQAINRRYIASQDQAVAAALAPYTATIQALAAAEALRSFGQKTDGKLPTTIVGLPTGMGGLLSELLRSGSTVGMESTVTPAVKQTQPPGR